MIRLLLGLAEAPQPLDVSDALAVAICHLHHCGQRALVDAVEAVAPPARRRSGGSATSWRKFKVAPIAGR
jgi:crossover junction endodeoxyribonuclease RuvC